MKLVLESGRSVRLTQLHQRLTYEGLLAGRIDARLNHRFVDELIAEAKDKTVKGFEPYVLRPSPAELERRLPAVAGIAVFDSGPVREGTEPYSSMTVAWFQDEFACLSAHLQAHIRTIDWERLAAEWCW